MPLWKTRSLSSAMGRTGVIAACAAVALFSFEAWIELSSGAEEAIEMVHKEGSEYVQGTCEYLDSTLVYAPRNQSFCKGKNREEVNLVAEEKALEGEGKILRNYASKLVAAGCCKEDGNAAARFFWMGEPEEVRVLCKAGCRIRSKAVQVEKPTMDQCEDVVKSGIPCQIVPDEPSGNSVLMLNVKLQSELSNGNGTHIHPYMRHSLARGIYKFDSEKGLSIVCFRTMWGKTEFEARCMITLPDKSRWLAWSSQISDESPDSSGNEESNTNIMVALKSHHLVKVDDIAEQDIPLFLLTREVAPSHDELESASMAYDIYTLMKGITTTADLKKVDRTPSLFNVVPFVALTPWILYFVLLGCYTIAWVLVWILARRAGTVTDRIDDASRAYARWASEKKGKAQCANGIREDTYVVIIEIGSVCHLTVDTLPSGVPLEKRPLLGTKDTIV